MAVRFSSRPRIPFHWQHVLGILLIVWFFEVAIAAPLLSPLDPEDPGPIKIVGRKLDRVPHPPSETAPLGTLPGQISVFHTLVWGTRSALSFGLTTALLTAAIGVLVGASSAYFGGWVNSLLMRITDAFLAFPVIAGVVLIQQLMTILLTQAGAYASLGGTASLPSQSMTLYLPENLPAWFTLLQRLNPLMIAFILFSWTPYARIMNTATRALMPSDFILATRALGAGHAAVIFRHLIPNAIAPMIILAARDVGGMVLLQATFTVIGLGGSSDWGQLLVRGRDWIIGPGGSIVSSPIGGCISQSPSL